MPTRPDPMRIYVLWHPDCAVAPHFATHIYTWFRGAPDILTEAGFGVPVRYRCMPDGLDSEQPRAIDVERAAINVIVPLVDENMVVSLAWRRWLEELADAMDAILYPVVLSAAAYQLPGKVGRLNFLRIDRRDDPADWSPEIRLATQSRRLVSLLTQACCRLLWNYQSGFVGDGSDRPGRPVKVFISHAKADGADIAEDIRLQVLRHGQMQAFFDESDLAVGYGYAGELEESASSTTTAMIAVCTDSYAGRPWCQREILLSRTPRRIDKRPCWRVKPLLVIDAIKEGNTRYLPEFGYSTVVRWHPERASALIDRFLREMLIHAHNEERAKCVLPRASRHAINCLPDLQTALAILRQTKGRARLKELVVPPPGFPGSDRNTLQELLGDVKLTTFEQVEMEEGAHV